MTYIKDVTTIIKKSSGNNVINGFNIGKWLHETRLLIKTMKRIQYERPNKGNENFKKPSNNL